MAKENEFIFGIRPVMEALRGGKAIDRVMLKRGLQGPLYKELIDEIHLHEVMIQYVPGEKIDTYTRKNHQGVLAWLSLVDYQMAERLLPGIYERGEDPLFLALDGITDVRNFGAIVRSADCFGVHGVLIPEKGSVRVSADAIKTSAGALLRMPVCRENNIASTIRFMKESGLKIIAATEKGDSELQEQDMKGPLLLIMGSEESGISAEILALADRKVSIPLLGNIASLNVSVASGIMLYEITRQRKQ